jgi:hypothetical protein
LLTQMLAVSSKKEVSNLLKEVDLAINSQTQ